jgi:hypothetical protein
MTRFAIVYVTIDQWVTWWQWNGWLLFDLLQGQSFSLRVKSLWKISWPCELALVGEVCFTVLEVLKIIIFRPQNTVGQTQPRFRTFLGNFILQQYTQNFLLHRLYISINITNFAINIIHTVASVFTTKCTSLSTSLSVTLNDLRVNLLMREK